MTVEDVHCTNVEKLTTTGKYKKSVNDEWMHDWLKMKLNDQEDSGGVLTAWIC